MLHVLYTPLWCRDFVNGSSTAVGGDQEQSRGMAVPGQSEYELIY